MTSYIRGIEVAGEFGRYCDVHWIPEPKYDEADYPPSMVRHVRAANRLSDPQAYGPIALATCSPYHLSETLDLVHRGSFQCDLYDASEGFTKRASLPGRGGFIPPTAWRYGP